MTAHRIPFVLPLPASLGNRRLSTIRTWAGGQVRKATSDLRQIAAWRAAR